MKFLAYLGHKFGLASVLTVLFAVLESFSDNVSDLVRIESALVFGVILLFVIDWFTGVAAAVARKEKITSHGFGRSMMKGIKIAVFLFIAVLFEGMFVDSFFHIATDFFTVAACFYISIIEAKSIIENVYGDGAESFFKGIGKLYRAIRSGGKPDDIDAILEDESTD